MMLSACAYLVNGDMLDVGVYSHSSLRRLQSEGYSGRELIHALITDDWGAPPRFVKLTGRGEDDRRIEIVIPYE